MTRAEERTQKEVLAALQNFSTGLVTEAYDYVSVTYPSSAQEVYAFKSGGVGGTTVATVTVNYVDSDKDAILNVART